MNANDQIELSDQLAVRDKDFMDYTAQLNAHEAAPVREFVDRTIHLLPNASIRTPAPVSTKFNNLYQDIPDSATRTLDQTRNGSPFSGGSNTYNFKT
jgi:hypothetical protein